MKRVLEELNPKNVFYFFEEISAIPRGSGNEKGASDYLMSFAKERGLEAEQDAAYNVIIRKPGSKGCENAPITMLQNHMDIVCEKVPECDIDFLKDGLRLAIDKEKNTVYAEGTSLGADNGIGLAIALAILDDNSIVHPPLEAVFTVGEEIGLVGASQLDMSKLKAKYMINSDSYRFDMVQAGCAGCVHGELQQDITWEKTDKLSQGVILSLGGLKGGHSGLDTTLQRSNVNILMGRFLNELKASGIELAVFDYSCVNKDNAIPRDASCSFVIAPEDREKTEKTVAEFFSAIKTELGATDPDVKFELTWTQAPEKHISLSDMKKMLCYLSLVPNGMFKKDFFWNDPLLAESSSNMGRIIISEDMIHYRSMIRTNFESRKQEVLQKFFYLADLLGMRFVKESNAPTWPIDYDSKLLAILKKCFKEMTGTDIIVAIAHGTCECGYFHDGAHCEPVSLGPDITGLHSPSEEVEISSVEKLYELNLRMLEEISKL